METSTVSYHSKHPCAETLRLNLVVEYVPVMTSPNCAAVMENLLARPLSPAWRAARYRLSSALPALLGLARRLSPAALALALRTFSSVSPESDDKMVKWTWMRGDMWDDEGKGREVEAGDS